MYDTRSLSLALTGVSYLEAPAALAINPALLEGVEKFSASLFLNPLFLKQTAPVQGPGSSVDTRSIGPLGALYFAGRIAPRVVFAGGFYVETGFAAGFDNVSDIDGVPNPPEDLNVQFFVVEPAVATSIRLSPKLNIGVALRIPVAKQSADIFANIAPVFIQPDANGAYDYTGITQPTYAPVKFDVKGVGIPSARFGISYKPIPEISLGAAYRVATKIRMRGTASMQGIDDVSANTEWNLPHALQFGVGIRLVNQRLLIAIEERMQFHAANRSGNKSEIVDVDFQGSDISIFVPLEWRNVYGTRIGVEYEISKLIAIRVGTGVAFSATTEPYAIYFTPPPGLNYGGSLGLGFNWEQFTLDVGGGVVGAGKTIGSDVAAQNQPATVQNRTFDVCSTQQVIRSGCAGDYKVLTFVLSLTLTYRM